MRFTLTVLVAAFVASLSAPALAVDTAHTFRVPVLLKRLPSSYSTKVDCTAYAGANQTGETKAFTMDVGSPGSTFVHSGTPSDDTVQLGDYREKKVVVPFSVLSYACTLSLTVDNKTITDPSKLPAGWDAVMKVTGNVTGGSQ